VFSTRGRLLALGATFAAAAVFRSWFLFGISALQAALLLVRRRRRLSGGRTRAASVLSVAAIFGAMGVGLLAAMVWVLETSRAPIPEKAAMVAVGAFPVVFFLYISFAAAWFAATGRRHPGSDRVTAVFRRGADWGSRDVF
jgi:hypothetical protein